MMISGIRAVRLPASLPAELGHGAGLSAELSLAAGLSADQGRRPMENRSWA